MSGFLYRGRHCGAEKRPRPRSIGPGMDFSCDEADKGPPVQMHSLREFEQHLNDLKKENFSLKLRIYFLEEKIQQKFEESGDDVHKRNIELKVEVESLKNELQEKQQLLDKALSTAESLSNQNEAELQRRLAERQEEISHMQEILETKVQLLQEEAELARDEAQRMASLADSEARRRLALERQMVESMEESGGSAGLLSQPAMAEKDRMIEELKQEKHLLGLRVEELGVKVHSLSSSLKKKEQKAEPNKLQKPERGHRSRWTDKRRNRRRVFSVFVSGCSGWGGAEERDTDTTEPGQNGTGTSAEEPRTTRMFRRRDERGSGEEVKTSLGHDTRIQPHPPRTRVGVN
ncbi:hypothetical protein Q5P01_015519 [Channa striata]|uniref:Centrosomin N-terminal motif 1 domain-containing protein n=1 Tax=Channa striata TaxID=64152 RepID=A0AA88MCD1_CHASR|nr:hypothetical protein Q5P01_015519 [Channa striata]